MKHLCSECGEDAVGFCNGLPICEDCAFETYGDLESLLDVALSETDNGQK
jgi:hypothetical protein